jgi:hypothetical protein
MLDRVSDLVETLPTAGGGHVSRWRNVIVDLSRRPSVESVQILHSILAGWMREGEGKGKPRFGVVVFVPAGRVHIGTSGIGAFQRELARLWEVITPKVAAMAFVVEEKGFEAASVRAFLTGVQLLTKSACPRRVFSDMDEAAEWLKGHMAKAGVSYGSPAELTAVIQDLAAKRA